MRCDVAAARPEGFAGWLAVWFGAGLSPVAPGTAGSLAALPCGVALLWAGGAWGWLLLGLAALLLLPLGAWAAAHYDRQAGEHDAGAIVVDEVAGQWIALLPVAPTAVSGSVWWQIALAFGLFRLFDIVKPWPAGWIDRRIGGGWGVMADDVAAGLYAGALTWLAIHLESKL